MSAFVLTPPDPPLAGQEGIRVDIFPGAATPAVLVARAPFWVGYGFAIEPERAGVEPGELPPNTRFELIVDGEPVALANDAIAERQRIVARRCIASFDHGLPPGWHRFEGRWYDTGALVLASDNTIEFVEP